MPLVNNLFKRLTWDISADFNHIAHPRTYSNVYQKPSLKDRILGSVLFALSIPLLVPAGFYLYWACKKVQHIKEVKPKSTEEKINQSTINIPVPQTNDKNENIPEEDSSSEESFFDPGFTDEEIALEKAERQRESEMREEVIQKMVEQCQNGKIDELGAVLKDYINTQRSGFSRQFIYLPELNDLLDNIKKKSEQASEIIRKEIFSSEPHNNLHPILDNPRAIKLLHSKLNPPEN